MINNGYNKLNDGHYEISYNESGVYLKVFPPIAKGRKVDVKEVLERLSKKKVRDFNKDIVEATVMNSQKTPVKIAESQEEFKIDATLVVNTTPDKMKASITIMPPDGGRDLTEKEILDYLTEKGVIFGLNMTTIDAVVKYPVYNEPICIAEGTLPENGQNGRVEYHFNAKKESKPTILEDGRVDFRELNLIENVKASQILCSLVPPLPGTSGRAVNGVEIKSLDGKPAVLPKGRNVEITPDGNNLIATIDGQVNVIDGKVSIFATYEVPADVDNSTGNISFVGNVTVRGNVLSGFEVEAGGNVEVWGVVEAATIRAGGDVILKRGMQGGGKGVIISNGTIIAKYIENSYIEAREEIKSEAIMHSTVKCGNKLELAGRKGLLVGGVCKVGKEIVAKVIGSQMATVTEIEVGTDPTLRERYKSLKEQIVSMDADIKKAEQAILILKKLEAAAGLNQEKQELLAKSVRTKVFYSNRIVEIKAEISLLDEKLQQEANGKVRVQDAIYPGTRVAIGSCMMYVKEALKYCCLYRDGADVRIGAFDK